MWNTLFGPPRKPRARRAARPRLEVLEERATPAAVSWINPGGGDWSDGTSWSTGSVPGPNDDVTIGQPGATVTHSSASADAVHSLTEAAGSGLELADGSLSFATNFRIDGTLLLDGGSLNLINKVLSGTGTVTNGPTSSWAVLAGAIQPTLDNQGYLEARGGVDVQGPFSNDAGATLEVVGDGTGTVGFRTLRVANGFTNDGLIETSTTQPYYFVAIGVTSGTLTNAADGTIHAAAGAGGSADLDAELNNQGTLTVDGPLDVTAANAAHVNGGSINVTGGDLNVNGSGNSTRFTNTGSIFIDSGRTLNVNYNITQFYQSAGSITGTGTLHLYGATGNFAGDFSTNGLTLYLEGDTYNSDGLLTVSPGDTLNLFRDVAVNADVENAGTVIVRGSPRLNGNYFSDPGSTTEVLGNMWTGGSNLIVANGFTNDGTIVLSSVDGNFPSALTVRAGALTNAADGTVEALVGTGGGRTLTVAGGGLINDGTVYLAAGAALTVGGDFTQNGDGDLAVEVGGASDFGRLTVFGNANLDGTLSVFLVNGYSPPGGAAFRVLTANQVNGTFATLDQDGVLFTPTYDPQDVTLVAN